LARRQQQQLKGFLALQDTGGPVYRASRSNGGFVREGGSKSSGKSGFARPGFSGSGFSGSNSSGPGASGPGAYEPSAYGPDSSVADSPASNYPTSTPPASDDSISASSVVNSFASPGPADTAPFTPRTAEKTYNDGLANSGPPAGSQPNYDRASSFQLAPPPSSAPGSPSSAPGSPFAAPSTSSAAQPLSALGQPNTATSTAAANPSAASLAKTRGADWALPNAARGAIPIRRPLYVTVDSGQLVLEPEPGTNEVPHNIAFGDSTVVAVQSMVASIWKRIEGWGVAGPGVYWKPTMEVAVTPDGEMRFRELASLLESSGIELKRR
jgi:hypothetical protein